MPRNGGRGPDRSANPRPGRPWSSPRPNGGRSRRGSNGRRSWWSPAGGRPPLNPKPRRGPSKVGRSAPSGGPPEGPPAGRSPPRGPNDEPAERDPGPSVPERWSPGLNPPGHDPPGLPPPGRCGPPRFGPLGRFGRSPGEPGRSATRRLQLATPALPVAGVLDRDAPLRERVAEAIGRGPVAVGPGGGPFIEHAAALLIEALVG